MREEPRTRLHRFLDAVKDGRFSMVDTTKANCTRIPDTAGTSRSRLLEFVAEVALANIPHYIITEDMQKLATTSQAKKSMAAMVEGGVAGHLPFDSMLVEMPNSTPDGNTVVFFCLLTQRSLNDPDSYKEELDEAPIIKSPFRCRVFAMSMIKNRADEAVVFPVYMVAGMEFASSGDAESGDALRMTFLTKSELYMESRGGEPILGATFLDGFGDTVMHAICLTTVLLHTRGVAVDVIQCKALNKSREKSGKHLIPPHRVIRAGAVYDVSGAEHRVRTGPAGWKMPVHWRAAHNRRIAFGKGRTERAWRHFPATLVNYIEGAEKPVPRPALVSVTRAARKSVTEEIG